MSDHRLIQDEDEVMYARHVAINGKNISNGGKYHYVVSKMRILRDLPGVVIIGSLVETSIPRLSQGKDQDFGLIKIMFYALFDDRQIQILKDKYPEMTLQPIEHLGKDAVILSWFEYKKALGQR